jgi:hypothetical protein
MAWAHKNRISINKHREPRRSVYVYRKQVYQLVLFNNQ